MMHSSLPVHAVRHSLSFGPKFAEALLYTGTRAPHAILPQSVFIFECLMYEMAEVDAGALQKSRRNALRPRKGHGSFASGSNPGDAERSVSAQAPKSCA